MTPQAVAKNVYELDDKLVAGAWFGWAFRMAPRCAYDSPGTWIRCRLEPRWCESLEYSRISDLSAADQQQVTVNDEV